MKRLAVKFSGVLALVGACSAFGQEWRGAAFIAPVAAERGVLALTAAEGLAGALRGASEALIEGFPLADGTMATLRLTRTDVMAADAEIVVMTPMGEVRGLAPASTFWNGTVDGVPGSAAYLAVSEERIDGLILDDDHTWVVSSGPDAHTMPTVVYDMRTISPDLVKVKGGVCQALAAPGGLPQLPDVPADGSGDFTDRGAPCRVATIAIETDYETTTAFHGDPAEAADRLARLMGAVSTIYARDLNVRLQIPYMRLWTTPEDPWDQTEMGPQLDQFRGVWAGSMRGVRRTLAHYLTVRGLGGGVAWVGVHCNYDYGFGLSSGIGGNFPYPLVDHNNNNWPVFVTAHELGHNFGTGHTHDSYDPVIDGCGNGDCSQAWGGTIMSYCHGCAGGMSNIVLNFGPRVVAQVHAYLDAAAAGGCRLTGSIIFRPPPRDVTVRRGSPAVMTAAATGPGVFSYRWKRNGVTVAGGEDGSLEIASASAANAGTYTVVAANACTSVTSTSAVLAVVCRADFNHDGFVDFFDYDAYVDCFEGSSCPPGETGDFNNDGFADFFDYDDFVAAFTGPC